MDITAFSEATEVFLSALMFIGASPSSVGGGIRTVEEMREILKTGADKIFINTGTRPALPPPASSTAA